LEQVHVRSSFCRFLRLTGFAVLSIGGAFPALAAVAQQATQTTLSAETRDVNGRTQAIVSIAVTGEDGAPAVGPVVIQDGARQLAGTVLKSDGTAQVTVDLLPGTHTLRAVFAGDDAQKASASATAQLTGQTSSTPDFQVAVNPASMSLTAGESGMATVSVTPVNASALTAPMFVTLSCSGFPDQSSCVFTPENIEILPNTTAAVTSQMVVTTQAKGTRGMATPAGRPDSHPVAWAVVLPGVFALGGLAFGARRRRWLQRLSLVALVGFVSALGMTACAPRYNYYNHGPPYNLPTPAGSYTLTVAAQSSNGVTATTHTTSLALTVK
jgi:hypothetical protein